MMLPIYLERDYYLTIADFAQQVVEQMHIDQFWRFGPQTPNIDTEHPFVRIGARVGCVRDPLQIEMRLEAPFREFMKGDVCCVGRGVDEPHPLQISPVGLLESLIAILRHFQATALDRSADRVRWRP